MAFIVVQHLDPNHESLLADLLAAQTSMRVVQAADGATIERENVYVIPPGVYLSVDGKGALRLSNPTERHGARLPFDFLLNSLAETFGSRVIAVIMSGTGADGSAGLKAVKAKHGLIIAQEIAEADYDGMPRSAIVTGAVDLVAPAAKIAAALINRERGDIVKQTVHKSGPPRSVSDLLPEIITLLRTKTVYDFSLYKHGTLERRVERRMAMAAVSTADAYIALLRRDRKNSSNSPETCLSTSPPSFVIPPYTNTYPPTSLPTSSEIIRRSDHCGYGLSVVAQARKRIRWPYCFANRLSHRSRRSNCRSSPATSIRMRLRSRGRAYIPKR